MQLVTLEQSAALLNPNTTRLVWVDILEANGAIAASTEPDKGLRLYRSGGSMSISGSAEIQRTVRVSFADPDGTLPPSTVDDLLHPLSGRRVRVRAGIRTWTRDRQDDPLVSNDYLWTMGLFDLFGADVNRVGDSMTVDIEADDLGSRVRDNAWPQGRYRARENVNLRLEWVLQQADPTANYEWAPTTVLAPNKWYGIDGRNDRLADLRALARRAGYRLVVDGNGTWRTLAMANPDNTVPVWTFTTEEAKSNVTAVSRALSRRDTYNVVVLDVESPEQPDSGEVSNFRVSAKVSDPNDPAWIGGPLGRRTLRERATKPMNPTDAQAAANARLREVRRTSETLNLTGLVNPALEPFDVIAVKDDATGTTDNHLLSDWTYNFDFGLAPVETQARRVRA